MNILQNKEQILNLLWNEPYKIGHWVGFNDLTELHNKWLRSFLFYPKDQTLQAHRGSYKTTTLSLFFALHTIIQPNESILYFRKTGSDVVEIARQTINILKSGCVQEIVRALYGTDLMFLKATGSEISTNLSTDTKGASQIAGLGIGTSITGKHADIVVTDDIVNINDRTSRAEREKTKIAYQELQNIKNRRGRFINTGTPWHPEDAFTLMPNPVKYDCYSTGLMTDAEVADVKSKMAPSLFAANYELRHIPSEDVIFTNPVTGGNPSLCEQGVMHVDSAFYGEDYTAWTVAKRVGDKYYFYGRMRRKHVEDCYDEIMADYQRFMCGKIYNENNADKGMVGKELRKLGMRVILYHEDMNKHIKIVTYLKAIWSDVVWVEGTDADYLNQICDYYEDAEHDDAPDSASSLARLFVKKQKKGSEASAYTPLWN